jgi:hypothetical protein
VTHAHVPRQDAAVTDDNKYEYIVAQSRWVLVLSRRDSLTAP